MKNVKNAKMVSRAWHHNVLTQMFTITEKLALLYKKVKFLTSPNPSRHHRLLLIFYNSLDIGKVKEDMVTAHIHVFKSRIQLFLSILGFY